MEDYDSPIEIRDARQPGWFWMDNDILDQVKTIGASGVVVYAVLARHANNATHICWPSLERIVQLSGLTKPTVISALKRLEFQGLIGKESGGGKNNPNRYTLNRKQLKKYTVMTKQPQTVKNIPQTVKNNSQTVKNKPRNYTQEQDSELNSIKEEFRDLDSLDKIRDTFSKKRILGGNPSPPKTFDAGE